MTFTATYRDKTGAMREKRVEAASRSEAVAALKAQGIVPVRLGEHSFPGTPRTNHRSYGTTGARHGSANATGGFKGVKGLAAALAGLILACGGLWWWLGGGHGKPALPQESLQSKPMPNKNHVTDITPKVSELSRGLPKTGMPITNAANIASEKTPVTSCVPQELLDKRPLKRPFKTGIEQVMSLLFTTRMGSMPFPLPSLSDDEVSRIWEILNTDVPVDDDDDDAKTLCKETVAAVKKEMSTFLMRGSGTPRDFLHYYQKILVDAHREYMLAYNECEKVKEEHPEIYDDFLDKVNKRLAEKGIRQVVIEDDTDDGENTAVHGTNTKDMKRGEGEDI